MKFGKEYSILKRTPERGMTMVEMVVALLISSLVILGVVSIYRFANKDWNDASRLEHLQQQTQDAMGWLERDVKQAVLTTGAGSVLQAPMVTTMINGNYGVIIIENVGTSGLPVISQAWYQLTTNINGALQRGVASYSGTLNHPTSWTTLLTGVTCSTLYPPFSVSTFDLTSDLTSLASDTTTKQSLTITSLNIQAPNNVPNSLTTYITQLNTTLTMQSNAQVQDYQLQGGL